MDARRGGEDRLVVMVMRRQVEIIDVVVGEKRMRLMVVASITTRVLGGPKAVDHVQEASKHRLHLWAVMPAVRALSSVAIEYEPVLASEMLLYISLVRV